jgi:hypothetical protein
MTRVSGDELRGGMVWNGFDYALPVWVVDGLGQACGHPLTMVRGGPCCAAFVLAGRRIDEMPGAQRRSRAPDRGAPAVADPAAPPTEA